MNTFRARFYFRWLLLVPVWLALHISDLRAQPEEIDQAVNDYMEDVRRGGLVLSMIRLDTFKTRSFGTISKENATPPSPTARFEIGSISQVFTSLLMMVAQTEEVILPESSIEDYFPEEAKSLSFKSLICTEVRLPDSEKPATGDQLITCRPDPFHSGACMSFCELALHNAGLPLALEGGIDWNPFVELTRWEPPRASMSLDTFFHRLHRIKLLHPPGKLFRHSNIGPALLGQLLAQAYGKSYIRLLEEKVLSPLNLRQTGIQPDQLLPGHDHRGRAIPPLQLDAQIPVAGLHSSANDLSEMVVHFLNPPSPDWEERFEVSRQDRIEVNFPTAPQGTLSGYGWFSTPLYPGKARRAFWQYGGTPGFRAFLGFVPATKTGVVLLTNQGQDLRELGFILLRLIQPSGRP